MTQLILDMDNSNISLPESRDGGYIINEEPLTEDVEMISGRIVKEVRGLVWVIEYSLDFFDGDDMDMETVIRTCKRGLTHSFECAFLAPETNTLSVSTFFVSEFERPQFFWSVNGEPIWRGLKFSLREVRAHA